MATAQTPDVAMPLKGLTGMYGDPQDTVDIMDEGVLEAKANPLHPDHGSYGSQDYGYSGTVPDASPFGGMSSYDAGMSGDDFSALPYDAAGRGHMDGPDDETSGRSHQAAYPRGIIQPSWQSPDGEYARAGDQLRQVHGTDLGGPEFYVNTAIADNLAGTDWTVDRYESVDDVALAQNTPDQQNTFTGPDSPYFEMGDIDGANTPWEGRIGDPSPYIQPPEPTIGTPPISEDVWA